jgi:predicted nucleic acid-binding protein
MFILDTNAFNRALDSGIDSALLSRRGKLYVTHIQLNELKATKRTDRLNQLLAIFDSVEQEAIPTSAGVWKISEWGGAEWGSAGGSYENMLKRLNQINGGKKNNAQDILIAVTALKHRYTLVTDDGDLSTVLREFGGSAESFDEFIQYAR